MVFKENSYDTFYFRTRHVLDALSRWDINRLAKHLEKLTKVKAGDWITKFYSKDDIIIMDGDRILMRTTEYRSYLEIQVLDFPVIETLERMNDIIPLEKTGFIRTPVIKNPSTLDQIIHWYARKIDKGVEVSPLQIPPHNTPAHLYALKERIKDNKGKVLGHKPGHYALITVPDTSTILEVRCSSTANELTFAEINARLEHVYFDLLNLDIFNPKNIRRTPNRI